MVIENAVNRGLISEETESSLLTYRKRLESNNLPVIYNLRHLRKIFQIRHNEQELFFGRKREKLYTTFSISKKSGGKRTIEAPTDRLKAMQKWILVEILDSFSASEYATGFRKNYSIVDNAKKHVGKDLVITIDVKDFFPSITYADVLKVFVYFGYKLDVAHLLTKLCTNANNVLPQGSPASPALSNLVMLRLDKRLGRLAESIGCDYSRYADDLTFSGHKNIRTILPLVEIILHEEGLTINHQKTRLQYKHQRQEVTGLVVNSRLSVSPKIKKELDNAIYFISKYGVADHMKHIGCDKSFYKEHLYGIAYFIKMVCPKEGTTYLYALNQIIWT